MHAIKPLTPETFPAWLALAQKHNGVWGGCYCSYFHSDTEQTVKSEYDGPTFKQRLVAEGVAHAALVFDGDNAIAWCEYGSPVELPGIYHRKQYDAGESNP
ncbi:MAG: GNAT family N-acetyltransferase, partial [Pseudolysinimonas sp.]